MIIKTYLPRNSITNKYCYIHNGKDRFHKNVEHDNYFDIDNNSIIFLEQQISILK